uniref:Uncharacterized protein n=1 Tax=Chlorella vulgaris TaxID=3077 RepID=V9H0S6_CHLVU|nr:hypothetical protein ChvulCp119 [Chlorella vulgaris]pir/T07306/ hypothetical protein 50 - Chlorella vulgaris chloroplast [Chlorella vulgaris]BAA57954.1 unnamed protein product [Chlorella vulgaris]
MWLEKLLDKTLCFLIPFFYFLFFNRSTGFCLLIKTFFIPFLDSTSFSFFF